MTKSLLSSCLISAEIVSQVHGRLRLRVRDKSSENQQINQLVKTLREHLAIYRVRWSSASCSVTIFYGKELLTYQELKKLLETEGIIWINSQVTLEPFIPSELTINLENLGNQWDQNVKKITQNNLDLRILIPIFFALFSLRQLWRKGFLIDAIPWYTLAWYSFDSFLKLNSRE